MAWQLRPPQAVALLRRAQQQYPADFWVNHNLGTLLCTGDAAGVGRGGAVPDSRGRLAPESPGAHHNLGLALKAKGQVDEAIACFRKAIELDPKFAFAHVNLGIALKDKGQMDEAIACYREAIELDPKLA